MGVIMINFRTPQSAGENFECTWEHQGAPATTLGVATTSLGAPTSLRAPTTSQGAPTTSLRAPTISLGAPQITVKEYGKNDIVFGNVAGAPGNYSYYLSFNDF